MSPQIPLSLKFSNDQGFDGFVGSPDSVAALQAIASGESAEWLYLSGPAGSGKSHLLLATCAAAQKQERRALYFPLTVFAGRLQDVLPDQENADVVCLDGLEHCAGHQEDEVALFHFHNRARAAGATVIYAARNAPHGLSLSLPDLQSRLGQCTRLNLENLDDDGRREVLLHRALQRGLELDDVVLDYMFKRVGRDLLTLTTLLDKLDRESLAAQRKITVPFLRKLLERN
ncbi:MAG: DnaA regulatory inactivator Hda [Arenimonas sp.]